MPDITMCVNENCPLGSECYRKQATPSMWQSMAAFEPVVYLDDEDKEQITCIYFVEIL